MNFSEKRNKLFAWNIHLFPIQTLLNKKRKITKSMPEMGIWMNGFITLTKSAYFWFHTTSHHPTFYTYSKRWRGNVYDEFYLAVKGKGMNFALFD